MRIEDELRGALDVPVPPPTTRLDDVVALGRRRVLRRRAGIAGSVLAVVAVVGIGAVAWPSEPRPVLAGPVDWPRATPAPGAVADPRRPDRACARDESPWPTLAHSGDVLSVQQMQTWRNAAKAMTPGRSVDAQDPAAAAEKSAKVYRVGLVTEQSYNYLQFTTGRFDSDPIAAADKALYATGGCSPPRRTIKLNGTVFQLYEPGPFSQSLFAFRVDGRTFRIDQVHGAGEDGLPMTEGELVALGAAVAEAP
ncbi:hypothetical protein [Lentzea sp. NPDC059081]|uniref:hypothetical protein n=1 Tax=Lentzea sp. NPDC059081 TaxID=3346719 RepID=UPI0036801E96